MVDLSTVLPGMDVVQAGLNDLSTDFGGVVSRRPSAVVRPTCADDLARVVIEARRRGKRLAVRGRGHSVFGQTLVEDGWVVDMSRMRSVLLDDDTAVVAGGATWLDVLQATVPGHRVPPVLTDYARLSVGGTVSMGGFGGASFRYGVQADNVLELTVVTGTGEVVVCSQEREGQLFDAVRAGLGRVGIIASARVRLVAAAQRLRHYLMSYDSLDAMLADLATLVERRDFQQLSAVGVIDEAGRWSFRIDAVASIETPEPPLDERVLFRGLNAVRDKIVSTEWAQLDYADRLEPQFEVMRQQGFFTSPHPWLDVILPADRLQSFAHEVVDGLTPEDLGVAGGMLLIYPAVRDEQRAPLLPVPEGGGLHYLFDVLRCIPNARRERLTEVLLANRALYERCRRIGGCLYPISAVEMTSSDWRSHFGSHWGALEAARDVHDPDRVLGAGWTGFDR